VIGVQRSRLARPAATREDATRLASHLGEEQLVRSMSDAPSVEAQERFEDFYVREYRSVAGLAYALSGSRWLAEDLAQEAFLAAHRNWHRVAGYDQPGAWVRRVVANLSASSFRRARSEAKAVARLALGRGPETLELSADDGEFWRAVRSLPRRQSQVVALFYLEDWSIDQVAEVLEIAPGTVKKHLYDGRRTLARRLRLEEEA
jgi:RNA polymerase sigma-70 factor (ECF subfamily)